MLFRKGNLMQMSSMGTSDLGHLKQIREKCWWFPWPWVKNLLRQSVETHLEECSHEIKLLTSLNITKTGCAVCTEKRIKCSTQKHIQKRRREGGKGELGGSCNRRDCWLVYRTTLTDRTEKGLNIMTLPQFWLFLWNMWAALRAHPFSFK